MPLRPPYHKSAQGVRVEKRFFSTEAKSPDWHPIWRPPAPSAILRYRQRHNPAQHAAKQPAASDDSPTAATSSTSHALLNCRRVSTTAAASLFSDQVATRAAQAAATGAEIVGDQVSRSRTWLAGTRRQFSRYAELLPVIMRRGLSRSSDLPSARNSDAEARKFDIPPINLSVRW